MLDPQQGSIETITDNYARRISMGRWHSRRASEPLHARDRRGCAGARAARDFEAANAARVITLD